MTPTEDLWQRLEALAPEGTKFHRDLRIGGQSFAFACRQPKVAIDIVTPQTAAAVRQARASAGMRAGYTVLVVENLGPGQGVDGVMRLVRQELHRRSAG